MLRDDIVFIAARYDQRKDSSAPDERTLKAVDIRDSLGEIWKSQEEENKWDQKTQGRPTNLWAIKYRDILDGQKILRTGFVTSDTLGAFPAEALSSEPSIWLGERKSFYITREEVIVNPNLCSHNVRELVDDTWDRKCRVTTGSKLNSPYTSKTTGANTRQ